MNYYNEHDKFAAAWLRELIKAGLIAPGVVDERSIEDVKPSELAEYTQCHFFAGIGVWSYALRQAGWPDDRPVWTGSCPCQPFSTAGKRGGTSDERHLWPAWFHLIDECRPVTVFGEQVEAAIRQGWLDLVQTDLEGIGYAFGSVGVPAAGFGAPHIRARLYIVGHANNAGPQGRVIEGDSSNKRIVGPSNVVDLVAHAHNSKRWSEVAGGNESNRQEAGRDESNIQPGEYRQASELANTSSRRLPLRTGQEIHGEEARPSGERLRDDYCGFWKNCEWLPCQDGKYRPVESGTFPLAHGAPARVGRLRGYGNALVAPVATAFIKAFLEGTE